MAFYNKPYTRLFESGVSPIAKLVYLQMESWFGWYKKNKPNATCNVFFNQIAQSLNISIADVIEACRELTNADLIRSWPDKKSVKIGALYTMEEQ